MLLNVTIFLFSNPFPYHNDKFSWEEAVGWRLRMEFTPLPTMCCWESRSGTPGLELLHTNNTLGKGYKQTWLRHLEREINNKGGHANHVSSLSLTSSIYKIKELDRAISNVPSSSSLEIWFEKSKTSCWWIPKQRLRWGERILHKLNKMHNFLWSSVVSVQTMVRVMTELGFRREKRP